jgi:nucleotide-binding universal stress UspA family protein
MFATPVKEPIMKRQTACGAVMVGVDGYEDSLLALRWALLEGQCTGRRVHLMHSHPVLGGASGREFAEEGSRRLLDEALEVCRDYPDVQVTTEGLQSRGPSPAAILLAASEGAEMAVVGCRGHRPPQGLLLGSVSERLARHATCPVVTVRPSHTAGAERVVLGLTVEGPSDRALFFAFEHASSRRVGLTVINVWHLRGVSGAGAMFPVEGRVAIDVARHLRDLDALLEPWRAKFYDVPVTVESIGGHAASVLRAAGEQAALMVVGRREKSGVGQLLGSVSQSVLHYAQCPVAVVG